MDQSAQLDQGEQRQRLGTNDLDIEDELLDEALDTVSEGAERLNRKWPELIITGMFGGIDVGLGILAMVLVKQATGSDVLAGMAFGVGLLALKLAHSELFTEEFLLPLNAVIAGQGTWVQMARLWAVTLVTDLGGGLAFAGLIVLSLPGHHGTIIDTAQKYLDQDSLPTMIGLSLLAGATITLSTRMQQGTSNDVVTAIVCLVSGLLVIGLGMLHGALNAIVIFAAMLAGADISIGQFLTWFAIVIPVNMLGGLLVISLPRVIRTWRVLSGLRRGEFTLEDLEEQAS
ncbi:formate/nitrite transporter family protein [Brachybacterium sp. Marseille-Q2903]|uniref:Formate/nitrite transporter family protein n=1 Tax=Brachybacterium epidermidis TaxID=2781983 RepID=A0ABR9W384_9MICO|nr:formate/nitrite transporter family protein [Brachybacterium epidermidis]MBE9404598.1 formate/nitrite transporter family protein [Brachybacterium epidermidis]